MLGRELKLILCPRKFIKATQADTLKKLEDDYGTDARDEVFKALRKELELTPLPLLAGEMGD